jgi:antitoxin HigA-1
MLPKKRCPSHPGIILLKHFLKPLGISQAQFVRHMGHSWTTAKLNEIIRGKRKVSLEVALDFADALETSPEFWLNLQTYHDLWQVSKHHEKIKPIVSFPTNIEDGFEDRHSAVS